MSRIATLTEGRSSFILVGGSRVEVYGSASPLSALLLATLFAQLFDFEGDDDSLRVEARDLARLGFLEEAKTVVLACELWRVAIVEEKRVVARDLPTVPATNASAALAAGNVVKSYALGARFPTGEVAATRAGYAEDSDARRAFVRAFEDAVTFRVLPGSRVVAKLVG